MFKITVEYTLEDVPTVVKSELVKTLNTEGTEFNSFLVYILGTLTEAIEELEKGSTIIATSTIEYILGFENTAKTIVMLAENEETGLEIETIKLESILINCKSIINAVARIRELQTEKIKELTPEEMLVVLTT